MKMLRTIIKASLELIMTLPFFAIAVLISAGILFIVWVKYVYGAFIYILGMCIENDYLINKSKKYTQVMNKFT